jgi:hypothetical protein
MKNAIPPRRPMVCMVQDREDQLSARAVAADTDIRNAVKTIIGRIRVESDVIFIGICLCIDGLQCFVGTLKIPPCPVVCDLHMYYLII